VAPRKRDSILVQLTSYIRKEKPPENTTKWITRKSDLFRGFIIGCDRKLKNKNRDISQCAKWNAMKCE
jgi:hypothetical protein